GRVGEIRQAIDNNQVLIIAGETGSGKTTQIPKICLQAGRGVAGAIAHTQPRRLAARSVSSRIAEELGVELGQQVGFQIRFSDTSSEKTLVKLMTDGILLAEIQQDPWLSRYDTIIIDEAHERSLNIDFLLGYIKQLLERRRDLKLIVTSATIDVDKFSRHFDDAPIIEVSGRTFPVEIIYRPPLDEADDTGSEESIICAVQEILQLERKRSVSHRDILIFLSGEKEIRDTATALRKAQFPHTEVLPLYARLGSKEQNRIFQPHRGRRIVLATNVAETSLTVPGIGYVIDSGKARISRYSVRSKVQRLPIEPISRASADQRAGRCGRLAPGICIRLYDEADFLSRPEFTDTEITRTHLGSVILQMLSMRLGNIEDFPFVDKPEAKAISDGFRLLHELGAVNDNKQLTGPGRQLALLPVDPKFGRMILEAARRNSLHEVLIIVSALSIQDPRERPLDKQQAADEKHRRLSDKDSDFLAFVRLWEFFEEQRQALSQNQLRKFCQQNFLSWMRMREWRDVHRQLHLVCRELKFKENNTPADYEQIHMALLSGLLSQIATRMEDGAYLGARNRKFQVFPGSSLFRRKIKWLLAAELLETSQLYARINARIEPDWVEPLAKDLVKKEFFEPHWEKKRRQVMAWEKVTLYGLTLVEKRAVPFSKIDPQSCRELFIREALVAMQMDTRADFYHHNLKLINKITQLEEKIRRRDILVDEEQLFQFYDARLPGQVLDTASLERWWRKLPKQEQAKLYLSEQDLVSSKLDEVDLSQFPDQLETQSMALKLDYQFSPGQETDGISIDVPVTALRQLKEEDLDWLVPGLLREKCIALIKALPKNIRKNFVPVPDYVDRLLPQLKQDKGNLRLALATRLKRLTGIEVPLEFWDDYQPDGHLSMNINVLDCRGKVIGKGRDLYSLREQFTQQVKQGIRQHSQGTIERNGLREWSFDELPEIYEVDHAGLRVRTYPALVDEQDSVALRLLDNEYQANKLTRLGLVRLIMLKMPQQIKYLKKNLLKNPQDILALRHLGSQEQLIAQLISSACIETFHLKKAFPRKREQFDRLFEKYRSDLVSSAQRQERLFCQIGQEYQAVVRQVKLFSSLPDLHLRNDINSQLDHLIFDGFLTATAWEYLQEYPRYLQAIQARLEKYPRQSSQDKQWTQELAQFWRQYTDRLEFCRKQEIEDASLEHFRWMLEEYRVSLFAQHLGTRQPVSAKRLEKLWLQTGIR
ncbi:MAG: ATP-dependent RNA helicase HrpA, partial [Pseudohongiellaceae bacterium]